MPLILKKKSFISLFEEIECDGGRVQRRLGKFEAISVYKCISSDVIGLFDVTV